MVKNKTKQKPPEKYGNAKHQKRTRFLKAKFKSETSRFPVASQFT